MRVSSVRENKKIFCVEEQAENPWRMNFSVAFSRKGGDPKMAVPSDQQGSETFSQCPELRPSDRIREFYQVLMR